MSAMFTKKGTSKSKTGKGNIAGIALHSDSVRYIELSGEQNSLKIVRQELVPLSRGAIIKDSMTSVEFVVVALENLKSILGGFKCPVVLGLPSRDVILRLVEYPKMPISDIKQALQFEFDKYFPYPYNEAAADVSEVEIPSSGASDKSTVLVATCKQRIVTDLVKVVSRIGMSLKAVEPMNVAFFRAATGPDIRTDSYFVVSVGHEVTQIILGYKDNGILFRSTVADLTSSSTRESEEGVMPILRDVQNTIIFASNQYRGLTPNYLILGGIVNKESRLGTLLQSNISLTVDMLNVWNLWKIASSENNTKGFEAAFGLAARDLI